MEDLHEQLPLLWTVAPLDRIHGTQVSGSSRMSNEVDAIFEHVIKPALGGTSHAKLFRKEGITLRDSFLFGFSICSYLHAHDLHRSSCRASTHIVMLTHGQSHIQMRTLLPALDVVIHFILTGDKRFL